jgi:hypothetical protein
VADHGGGCRAQRARVKDLGPANLELVLEDGQSARALDLEHRLEGVNRHEHNAELCVVVVVCALVCAISTLDNHGILERYLATKHR